MASAAVSKLPDNANGGPDIIPPFFVKRCWPMLEKPVLHIFNNSLKNGHFPKAWKFSYVLPIFKSGDRNDVRNYRPISIIGTIAKLFDAIVSSALYDKIAASLSVDQHGFVRGRSTLTNLLLFNDCLSEALESSFQVDTIYTDFSKAFDTVDHSILIDKLHQIGIRGQLLAWFSSYLSDRTFAVRINNCTSSMVSVASGVPQGSHLGPLLFCVYINDIVGKLRFAKVLLYADDVKLFSVIRSSADSQLLQRDLDALAGWSSSVGLRLNLSKCFIISYSRSRSPMLFDYFVGSVPLKRASFIKDLGIWFDSSLSFSRHIDHVILNTSKLIGFIKRSTAHFSNTQSIIYLYRSLVLPHFTYLSQIWAPFTLCDKQRLESIQHRFLRYVAYKSFTPMHRFDHYYDDMASELGIVSITSLLHYHDCVLAFKLKNGLFNSEEINNSFKLRELKYSLRYQREISESDCRTNYGFFSTLNRLRRVWNVLPSDLKVASSVNEFKTRIFPFVTSFSCSS